MGKNKYTNLLLHCKLGIGEILEHKWKIIFLIMYFIFSISCYFKSESFSIEWIPFHDMVETGFQIIVICLLILGLLMVIALIGNPFRSRKIQNEFLEKGLVNKKNETPILSSKKKDQNSKHGIILEFYNKGISMEEWDKVKVISEGKVYRIEYGKRSVKRTRLYILPFKYNHPTVISSTDNYLCDIMFNCLCVGATGTGKSYCLLTLLGKMAKFIPEVSITICDYKKSSFAQFEDTPNFYGYMDVPDGIRKFYDEFTERLQANDEKRNKQVRILLIDEYGALISAQDKKNAEELKTMLGNMLFMGRSLGIMVYIGVQRGDSEHFKAGARDQFKTIFALGNLSKEQKQMLFSDYKEKMDEHNGVGEGYLLIDGRDIERITVAPIDDFEKLNTNIKQTMYH